MLRGSTKRCTRDLGRGTRTLAPLDGLIARLLLGVQRRRTAATTQSAATRNAHAAQGHRETQEQHQSMLAPYIMACKCVGVGGHLVSMCAVGALMWLGG